MKKMTLNQFTAALVTALTNDPIVDLVKQCVNQGFTEDEFARLIKAAANKEDIPEPYIVRLRNLYRDIAGGYLTKASRFARAGTGDL